MIQKAPLILLIDDNKEFLEIFGDKLSEKGYAVVKTQGGDKGLEQIIKVKPSLVLLDLEMPGENGFEVLSKIQKEVGGGKFRVAFLTNHGEPESEYAAIDKKYAVDVGAVDYIRKSEDLDSVVSRVEDILAT